MDGRDSEDGDDEDEQSIEELGAELMSFCWHIAEGMVGLPQVHVY